MSKNYRKIWEIFNNAKIPKGHHIHHIDGNHQNNEPVNLLCCSPEEHNMIHFLQGDIFTSTGGWIKNASEAGRKGGAAGKGKKISEEGKRNIAEGRRKYNELNDSPLKGKKLSEEHRHKISKGTTGEKNPMFGHVYTEETLQKQRVAKQGMYLGKDNPMFGKKHTEETLQKQREIKLGRKWYNNGIISITVFPEDKPDGFIEGRLWKK